MAASDRFLSRDGERRFAFSTDGVHVPSHDIAGGGGSGVSGSGMNSASSASGILPTF